MFGTEFYPTPKHIIRKMIEPYTNLKDLTVLEPSAGKGDILDYIKEKNNSRYNNDNKFYCIESDKNLQFILNEKGYRLISEDFLNYSGDYFFDLIIMNPPFSNGDAHLLKAWEILKEGDICCLLNAETIKNPYTEKRKLLQTIIQENGSIEFLRNCFATAERPNNVDVVMVRLTKKAKGNTLNFEFKRVTSEKHFNLDETTFNNPIATRDVIGNMVIQYEKLKEIFVEYLKVQDGLNFYSQGLLKEYTKLEKILKNEGNNKQKYNSFCDKMKNEIWSIVINKMGMGRYMTHNVRENFSKFIKDQGAMDFTRENVFNLIKMILQNKDNILENAVIEVFDMFTKYYKENRCYVEGWKTNDSWKVNRRVILPYFVKKGYHGTYRTSSHHWSEYSDIDKVMSHITGIKFESVYSLKSAIENTSYGDSSVQQSEFFNIRCYKKGTLHIEFRDKYLWEEFNMRACDGKKWLPKADKKQWETQKERQYRKVI